MNSCYEEICSYTGRLWPSGRHGDQRSRHLVACHPTARLYFPVLCSRPSADGGGEKGERNIRSEAARIARGQVLPIEDFKAKDYDALVFSGGFGVAKNLCDYAYKGAEMEVQPDVARVILEMHKAKKPIGGMCIAPVLFAKLVPGVHITLGTDGAPDAENAVKMGAHHLQTEHGDVVADNENLVYTTPAFMLDATIRDVYDGAYNLIDAILGEE